MFWMESARRVIGLDPILKAFGRSSSAVSVVDSKAVSFPISCILARILFRLPGIFVEDMSLLKQGVEWQVRAPEVLIERFFECCQLMPSSKLNMCVFSREPSKIHISLREDGPMLVPEPWKFKFDMASDERLLRLNALRVDLSSYGCDIDLVSVKENQNIFYLQLPVSKSCSNEPIDAAEAVLIEDDFLIRESWAAAARKNDLSLDTYERPEEFLSQLDRYSKTTTIYIDESLGDQLGHVVAKHLYESGYQKIFLQTGYSADKFKDYYWVLGVLGKRPPF